MSRFNDGKESPAGNNGIFSPSAGEKSSAGGGEANALGVLPMAEALREICRRIPDFVREHPSYLSFVDSLITAAQGGMDETLGSRSSNSSSNTADGFVGSSGGNPSVSGGAGAATVGGGSVFTNLPPTTSAAGGIGRALEGNARQRHQWKQWQQQHNSMSEAVGATATKTKLPPAENSTENIDADPSNRVIDGRMNNITPPPISGDLSSLGEYAAMSERALGAVVTAVAKESGGKEAAAVVLLQGHKFDG